MRPRQSNHGLTLLQVLLAIGGLGFLVAASIPNLSAYQERRQLRDAARGLMELCQQAQVRARQTPHAVFIEVLTDADAIALVEDQNGNGLADAGEIIAEHRLSGGLDFASTTLPQGRLPFDARGVTTAHGDLVVRSGSGMGSRWLEVPTGTGAVRIRCAER